jgi:hypothetical protein
MKTFLVRSAALLLVASAVACGGSDEAGSDHLSGLKEGMTTAQALETMGTGPLAGTYSDTMRITRGFRRSRYLLNGVTFEVIYARDLPGDVKEPVLQARETPVVFRNDTLQGWGWKYYAETAIPKFALPTPLRAIDTMTTKAVDNGPVGINAQTAAPAPDTTKKP